MAGNAVRFIPGDFSFAPDYLKARMGVELIARMLPEEDSGIVSFSLSPNPALVDNGRNLRSIHCPQCGEYVSQVWWSDAVADAYRDDFWELDVDMPCCGKRTSLNALRYEGHVGFARFVLVVDGAKGDVPVEEIAEALTALYEQPFFAVLEG